MSAIICFNHSLVLKYVICLFSKALTCPYWQESQWDLRIPRTLEIMASIQVNDRFGCLTFRSCFYFFFFLLFPNVLPQGEINQWFRGHELHSSCPSLWLSTSQILDCLSWHSCPSAMAIFFFFFLLHSFELLSWVWGGAMDSIFLQLRNFSFYFKGETAFK